MLSRDLKGSHGARVGVALASYWHLTEDLIEDLIEDPIEDLIGVALRAHGTLWACYEDLIRIFSGIISGSYRDRIRIVSRSCGHLTGSVSRILRGSR